MLPSQGMAASSTNSWLNTSLLSPNSLQQSAQHALYGSDLHVHSTAHVQAQQQMGGLGHDTHRPCGAFCQPDACPYSLDFHHSADSHPLHDFSKPAGGSSCGGHAGKGSGDHGSQVSARKVHKADREKLRRDRLNEQFAELAGVLDPDRPKNDKATILGDSVQVVKELRSELKRLRSEQSSLLDESRDLAQEKTELREEKAALKNETEYLHTQLQQRLRLMIPWMSIDPSMMMGPAYGYPMPVPQAMPAPPPTSEANQPVPQVSLPQPVSAAPPYMPLASPTPSPFALHPGFQGYTMYANRPADGNTHYVPYPAPYPSQVTSHPHVERPYPQYASPMQPYLMQMQGLQGPNPMTSMYQSYAPSMSSMPPRTDGSQARVANRPLESACDPHSPPVFQPYLDPSGPMPSVQTTLQLQTPVHPQPQRTSQTTSHLDNMAGSVQTETGGTGSPAAGLQRECQPAVQTTPTADMGKSTDFSPGTAASATVVSLGSPGTCSRGEGEGGLVGAEAGLSQWKDLDGTHDPKVRPPAA